MGGDWADVVAEPPAASSANKPAHQLFRVAMCHPRNMVQSEGEIIGPIGMQSVETTHNFTEFMPGFPHNPCSIFKCGTGAGQRV
jgi:hypothetical protein